MKSIKIKWEWKILLITAALCFAFVGILTLFQPGQGSRPSIEVTTLIPQGDVLVPIEVENYESLDSILGSYGFADLFSSAATHHRPIMKNVRILRAPQNPSHFAVLIEENQAPALLAHTDRFYVVVKGRSKSGTELVNKEPMSSIKPAAGAASGRRRIIYEGD